MELDPLTDSDSIQVHIRMTKANTVHMLLVLDVLVSIIAAVTRRLPMIPTHQTSMERDGTRDQPIHGEFEVTSWTSSS